MVDIIQPIALPALVAAGGPQVVASPFQFFLTGAENLRIISQNSAANATIAVQGRFFSNTGAVSWFRFTHQCNTDRSVKQTDHPLGEGVLSNLVAIVEPGGILLGTTFVTVQIILGIDTATTVLGTLVQGYLSGVQSRAWPGHPLGFSVDGPGLLEGSAIANPAPATDIVFTVPVGARFEILSFGGVLTTSGIGGNRQPRLRVQSGSAGINCQIESIGGTGAGGASFYQWAQGLPLETTPIVGRFVQGLPRGLMLKSGDQLSTQSGLLAGDQWQDLTVLAKTWIDA